MLSWMWLCARAEPVALQANSSLRVTQSTSWSFFAVSSDLMSQYWALSLSVVSTAGQLALMVRGNASPELTNGDFTADYIDLSSFQFNLTSHVLFFQPRALGDFTAQVGVYFFSSSLNSSATYLIKITAQETAFCPNNCSSKGTCDGFTCTCQSGFLGIDCRISTQVMTRDYLTFPVIHEKWQLVTLPGQTKCKLHTARVTMTTQASSNSLHLLLYMSSAKSG